MSNNHNRHHIMHNRMEWDLRPEGRKIRHTESLVPRLDKDAHDALHEHCPAIPLLGHTVLQLVNNEFQPTKNTFVTLDRLMLAIDEAGGCEYIHDIDRAVCDLAVQALYSQIPYLKGNIIKK